MTQCRKTWWSQRGHKWRHNMRMCVACWIRKATCTHAHAEICNTYSSSTATMIRECSLLHYTYVVCFVVLLQCFCTLTQPPNMKIAAYLAEQYVLCYWAYIFKSKSKGGEIFDLMHFGFVQDFENATFMSVGLYRCHLISTSLCRKCWRTILVVK
jgi:hypothetical protein